MKHVVLWRDTRGAVSAAARVNAASPGAAPAAKASPSAAAAGAPATPSAVEIAQLTVAEAKDIARDPNIAAIAPAMPMRLIQPFEFAGAADALAGGVTWGVKAVGADTSPFTGDGIVVAVLDTGIDPNHPAFAGVQLVRRNFTTSSDDDDHGHGTHCAGTIFGRDVQNTRIGVARGVTKALIGKVLGEGGGGSDTVANAIKWAADNGANVISMSLGIDFPGFVQFLIQSEGFRADVATSIALEAYRANINLFEGLADFLNANSFITNQATVVVAAAGNESGRSQAPPFEIAVSPPAIARGVVSVAALQQGAAGFGVADFSNTGARVSGPGVGVLSARMGGGLVAMSGTSMATPHVAGVAALWAQKLRRPPNQLTAIRLLDELVGSATQTGFSGSFDPSDIGGGIVRAPQS
jgi:subtilisin family serine protease